MEQGRGVKNQCAVEKPQAIFNTVNVTRAFFGASDELSVH